MRPVPLAVLFAVLAGCGACGAAIEPPPSGPEPVEGLTPYEQDRAAVRVFACEAVGSGVIVSKHHVLTAFHVVEGCGLFVIRTFDGEVRMARLEVAHSSDLARLVTLDGDLPDVRVRVAPSSMGDVVCQTPAYPERVRECGIVKMLKRDRNESGDVRVTTRVVKGNSGAPVWNSAGLLVGIAVQCDLALDSTEEHPKCAEHGGGYTSVESVPWIAEDVTLR